MTGIILYTIYNISQKVFSNPFVIYSQILANTQSSIALCIYSTSILKYIAIYIW